MTVSPLGKPLRSILEDHWSCIARLSAEDMLYSSVIEDKKFKNIESERSGPRSMNGLAFGTHKASCTHFS